MEGHRGGWLELLCLVSKTYARARTVSRESTRKASSTLRFMADAELNQSQEPLFSESDTTAGLIFSMVERNGQNSTHGLDRKFLSCGLAQDVPSTGTACSFPRLRLLTMTFHHLDNYLVTFNSSEKATLMYNPFLVCNTSSGKNACLAE